VFSIIYLIDIFNPAIQAKAKRGQYLLIVDRYSSYINIKFIITCDRLKILLLILPPYLIYRL